MEPAQDTYDAAMGCLLGALVGDAAGATLEFLGRQPTQAEVNRAMMMPGGGIWQVAPGQITDDGELTLCLAQALAQSKNFEIETVAQTYAQWVASKPFDIGSTTAASLGSYSQSQWQEVLEQEGYAAVMTQAAAQRCMKSKANGSLMRISPLGIWGYQFNNEELAKFAQQDSRLSHPNPSCCYAVACYTIAISSLIREPGDRKTAFNSAKSWLESQAKRAQNKEFASNQGQAEVLSWLQDAENNINISYHPHAGFVKIAFTHAFRHLLLGSDYFEAIRETLSGGGDTDTNACIVGGLIGAACGAKAIPEEMTQLVLNCDTQQGANPRPQFLSTTQVPLLIKNFMGKLFD
ncbi:MAG: ADP-ribosylglycohydrolase family protein [Symploca sp. SIO2C1]|nr:ADP-ribosylglycohydrolase family protein [Symploca sp. SIO2C1]